MTEVLELFDKVFKTAMIKMLRWANMNTLEAKMEKENRKASPKKQSQKKKKKKRKAIKRK